MAATVNRRRTRREGSKNYLPLAYIGLAVLAAVLALPSALRPPNQQPNQTAELSPDAPPDKNQTAILSSLNRASSGVAGNDTQAAGPNGAANAPTQETVPPPPRACPNGVGNPPRQVESLYAPGCAPPFSGDNGGATSAGVTATEIRIGFRGTANKGNGNDCGTNGRVDDMNPTTMDAATRTIYVFEKYFNKNFQLYGRRISFYCIEPASLSIADEQAEAVDAANQYGLFFAAGGTAGPSCPIFAERHIINFCEAFPADWYRKNAPYSWSAYFNADEEIALLVEETCKNLAGKPASLAGTPDLTSKRRRFVLVIYDGGRGYAPDADTYKNDLKRECNEDLDVIYISSAQDSAQDASNMAAAVATMRQNGDTTVVPGMDWVDLAVLTNSAQSNGFIPEWFVNDGGALTRNQLGQLQNQAEWAHAFGLSGIEPERPDKETECFRAYHSIDPANDPNAVICRYQWDDLLFMVSGIQLAGPKLTPQSYQQGWFSMGMRYYDHPVWALGGGYGPGTYSYPHNIAFVWWDPTAQDPSQSQGAGAYRYLFDAKRFCLGQVPSNLLDHYFKDGVILPPDYNSYSASQPRSTC